MPAAERRLAVAPTPLWKGPSQHKPQVKSEGIYT